MANPWEPFDPLRAQLEAHTLEARTILMFGEVDAPLAERVTRQLLLLAARGREPIRVLVNAQGGPASTGEALHDVIAALEAPVRMLGMGSVANAALLAFVAAPREARTCLPSARFSLRQRWAEAPHVAAGADVDAERLRSMAEAVAQQRERVVSILRRAMTQNPDVLRAEVEQGGWLDAEEARIHGLVGEVVRGGGK